MKFRLAKMSDLIQLKEMYQEIVKDMYQKNITIWDEYYPAESVEEDIKNGLLYILEENHEMIAASALVEKIEETDYIKWEKPNEKACYIARLGVNPKNSCRGIGSKMIEKLMQEARRKKAKYLRLLVVDTNEPAINFYLKNRFKKADGILVEKIDEDCTFTEFGFEIECK